MNVAFVLTLKAKSLGHGDDSHALFSTNKTNTTGR
jgi:hypothetical protein